MSTVKTWEVWGDLEEANTESCQRSCKWRYIHISFSVALLPCWIYLKKDKISQEKWKLEKWQIPETSPSSLFLSPMKAILTLERN